MRSKRLTLVLRRERETERETVRVRLAGMGTTADGFLVLDCGACIGSEWAIEAECGRRV